LFTLQSHPQKKVTLVTTIIILNYDRTRPKGDRRQLQKSKLRWASALKGTCPVWHRTDRTDLLVHKAIGLDRMYFLARKRDAHSHGRSALIFHQHVCNYDSGKASMARQFLEHVVNL
jgi:membrane protein required for beta-lactamase induction